MVLSQVNGHEDIFSYLYASSLVRRSSVVFVLGPQADFIRGLPSTRTDLSALLLEDGRFGVYGRKTDPPLHFSCLKKQNTLGENSFSKLLQK